MDQSLIRNFCIIAHIDHGKSTLADRLLEMTHTVSPMKMHSQFLDSMDLGREKGITIKLKAVRLHYPVANQEYIFNLIDTPGHVDFAYEVSRSLAACEGALLLIDATQGVQAQTLANYYSALEQGLTIIPVINKIDMINANIEAVKTDLMVNMGFNEDEILYISAKTGEGIDTIFPQIVKKIPAPTGQSLEPFRALVFDSAYDQHKGVIVFVKVVDGIVGKSDRLFLKATNAMSEIIELGYLYPQFATHDQITAGEVGYIATGLKDLSLCRVGDTLVKKDEATFTTSLPGYRPVQPMVFSGLYPVDADDFLRLKESLLKIKLTDASIEFTPETSPALGNGYRCGFLGLLHAEITQERLEREYDLNLIATVPNVEYELRLRGHEGFEKITTPFEMPDAAQILEIREPWVKLSVFSPNPYLGGIMQLTEGNRSKFVNMEYYGDRVHLIYEIPLSELIIDYYDQLKSVSSGYASLDYTFIEFRPVEAVKLDILVAGDKVDAFSQIVVKSQAEARGRQVVKKLKDVLPKQMFKVSLQAAIGGKIIAREDLAQFRKDVTAKLYGGDVTRKMKLLEKQKKGKARMKRIGKVDIPQEAFLAILKKSD